MDGFFKKTFFKNVVFLTFVSLSIFQSIKPATNDSKILSFGKTFDHIYINENQISELPKSLLFLKNKDLQPNFLSKALSKVMGKNNKNKIVIDRILNNQYRIEEIGKEKIENILNKMLSREIALQDTHYTFYHGQKLEFLLFQDLIKVLYEILNKTKINNFVFVRIPDSEHYKYNNYTELLNDLNNYEIDCEYDQEKNYDIDDNSNPARKLLLSVTPFLLGYSTFSHYFLDSQSCFYINNYDIIKDVFSFFDINFYLFKKQINKLLDLLSNHISGKTGIILQYCIPKTMINRIAYRSVPGGTPYYSKIYNYYYYYDDDYNNPENFPAEKELEKFKDQSNLKNADFHDIQDIQFRLFLHGPTMLNPHNAEGIKVFRYFNKTPNTIEYKRLLNKLIEDIKQEINNYSN